MSGWKEYNLNEVYDFSSGLSKGAFGFGFGHGSLGRTYGRLLHKGHIANACTTNARKNFKFFSLFLLVLICVCL